MYRITVDKEFIKYPQLWGSIIKEGTSMLVNDDFINSKEVATLISIGALKIVPVASQYEEFNYNRSTSKRRRKLLELRPEEAIEEKISENIKEGVD